MKLYSQNLEDQFITDYFTGFTGTLLSVGENDGETFSNAKALIDLGWSAHLLEPASVFYQLKRLHMDNKNVHCYNLAIGETDGITTLFESGAHVHGGTDKALVSSLSGEETERWRKSGVIFHEKQVPVCTFKSFWEIADRPQFDFISIDAEGFDWIILQQIDLATVGCKCLVIEWNSDENLKQQFCEYCQKFGLIYIFKSRENIIFIKK